VVIISVATLPKELISFALLNDECGDVHPTGYTYPRQLRTYKYYLVKETTRNETHV
jgi:hypothetical protein